jgi:succinyl-diaminopimelate desuccinylase
MEALLHWAERFIATPSVSQDGNRAMAELATTLLGCAGLDVRLQRACGPGPEQINVIAEAGPHTGRDLLLLTHLDTVPPGDPSLWTATGGDPFRPTRDGDRLYGLGSADAKVDLVCKAFALASVDLRMLRRAVRVVGTFAEEIGLRGARHLIETGETRGSAFALVGEPSELVGIHAHKGYAVFEGHIPLERVRERRPTRRVRTEVRGASVHSSTPELGENAVEGAIERLAPEGVVGLQRIEGGDTVNRVPDRCALEMRIRDPDGLEEEWEGFGTSPLVEFLRAWRELLRNLRECRDPEFDPDHTVGNLGKIRIDGSEAVVTFDLRTIPGVDPRSEVERLSRVARVECLRANPPLFTPMGSAIVEAVRDAQRRAGLEPRISTKATSTEAGVLSAEGIETVVLGPGLSIGNVHRPNEHTRISQLERAVEIYRGVVERICIEESAPCIS